MKKLKIPLNKINLEDERFRISYHSNLDKIILSLKKIGLVNPPIVTLRRPHIILVSGWKRVLGYISLSFSQIPVYMLDEKDDLKAFKMSFFENLAVRSYDTIEKAEIVGRLKKFGEDKNSIIKKYFPLINIPSTRSHLDVYLAAFEFEPEIKKLVLEKNTAFVSLQLLTEFNSRERRLLLPLLSCLSQNKIKEILEDLLEICRKYNVPAWKFLLSRDIMDIQGAENLSPLQKADKIRLILKRKRYPTLFSWTKSFDSALKKICWPEEISISPSKYFEGEEISVNFSFENMEEFRKKLSELQKLSSKEEFSDIFKSDLDE